MAIIAKASTGSGDYFEPSPQGVHRAICVDVVDRGMVAGKFGEKHQVRIVWQLETKMTDGRPYLIDRNYTLSLDERAALRHDLETWAGKPLTLEQAAGFDLEKLIGVTCTLLVVHKKGTQGDRVFSNVSAVLPKQPGPALTVTGYTRTIHRAGGTPQPVGPSHAPAPQGYSGPQAPANMGASGWPQVLPEPKPVRPPIDDSVDSFDSGPMDDSDIPF